MENADPRYGSFTPAQWACIALFGLGLVMVWKIIQLRKSGEDPLELVALPRGVSRLPPDVPIEPAPATNQDH
jgi:hypothetical protein